MYTAYVLFVDGSCPRDTRWKGGVLLRSVLSVALGGGGVLLRMHVDDVDFRCIGP